MNITYVILDDDIEYLPILVNKISFYTKNDIVYSFSYAMELIEKIQSNCIQPDILFLDIDMPNIDGISFAKKIYEINENIIIIFITNKVELVYEAFGLNVFRFISKSNLDSKIKSLFDDLKKEIFLNQIIAIEHNEKCVQVRQNEIIYIEKIKRNIYIYTLNNVIEFKKCNLSDVFLQLKSDVFQYANRSTIINMESISLFKKDYVILNPNKTVIYLSRDRIKQLHNKFIQLMNH